MWNSHDESLMKMSMPFSSPFLHVSEWNAAMMAGDGAAILEHKAETAYWGGQSSEIERI